MKHRFQLRLGLALFLILCFAACKDQTLASVAHDLNVTTKAMHDVQQLVIASNKTVPPLIDDNTAKNLMGVCLRIDRATGQAITLTRNLNALGPADKQSLSAIVSPVLDAVKVAVNDPAVSSIKDPTTRSEIQVGLAAIQTSLTTIQALIAAGK